MDKIKRNPKLTDVFTEEFQRALVTLFYRNLNFCSQNYAKVKSGHFSNNIDRNLFEIIHLFYRKYKRLPTEMEAGNEVAKQFWNDSQESLKEIHFKVLKEIFAGAVPEEDYIEDNLTTYIKKAEFGTLVADSLDSFRTLDLDSVKKRMTEICDINLKDEDFGMSENSFINVLMEDDDGDNRVKTTFKEIDNVFGGGLIAGHLAMIIAPVNRGKTSLLINLCKGLVIGGSNVLHLTLEMAESETIRKYIASMTGITENSLKNPKTLKSVNQLLLEKGIYTDKSLKVKYFPEKTLSIEDTRAFIHRLEERDNFRTDVLAVDYADLFNHSGAYKERRHQLSEIFVDLRRLGSELGIPVITVSQTNKKGEQVDHKADDTIGNIPKPLNLTHVAEDWTKVATCDFVFGIRRPTKTEQLGPNEELMIVDVLKSRASRKDYEIYFKADFSRCMVDETEPNEVDLDSFVKEVTHKKKLI